VQAVGKSRKLAARVPRLILEAPPRRIDGDPRTCTAAARAGGQGRRKISFWQYTAFLNRFKTNGEAVAQMSIGGVRGRATTNLLCARGREWEGFPQHLDVGRPVSPSMDFLIRT